MSHTECVWVSSQTGASENSFSPIHSFIHSFILKLLERRQSFSRPSTPRVLTGPAQIIQTLPVSVGRKWILPYVVGLVSQTRDFSDGKVDVCCVQSLVRVSYWTFQHLTVITVITALPHSSLCPVVRLLSSPVIFLNNGYNETLGNIQWIICIHSRLTVAISCSVMQIDSGWMCVYFTSCQILCKIIQFSCLFWSLPIFIYWRCYDSNLRYQEWHLVLSRMKL